MSTTSPTTSVAPNFSFVLIDLTTDKTPSELKPAPSMQSMIDAWQEQAVQYGQHYGMPSVSFRIGSGPDDRTPLEIAIHFRDTIDEAPGALAYHQVVNGVPDIELGVDLFSSLTSGGESVCAGGSHELLETFRDAGANEWSEKQDGSNLMGASEVCDPVQNTSYNASNGNGLSNFVLPSYFVPQSLGPWDYLGVMQAQNDYSNGYEIQAGAPTSTSQVGGMRGLALQHGKPVFIVGAELSEKQKRRKSHPYSRTHRRGVRL
jgi:hypothetical protein